MQWPVNPSSANEFIGHWLKVIFGHFGSFLDCSESFWLVFGRFCVIWVVLGCFRLFLGHFRSFSLGS